ncbi:MAG: high-potential iron-sulfur protein [Halorhodospira halophila]|uniref:high-potential iron-sulfur protein n=1 Tax=Halorhodospira TaxID=85108 RepID=UPI0019141461|nr:MULTISPECIES: high-potential iron-sulfur protein [Halorhodospira]MBK5943684.1 histidine kinase [Halorhodospira halophila]MCC3749993.1 high-potential iron-sulfur protein [Halorhodospira halophila]MCG5528313.1 high-potential iron-sulfur protein [Halorhodospira halophila]MCG5544614.1 high-potential iron-sulfur protein [Halorhodospira sp. 9628]
MSNPIDGDRRKFLKNGAMAVAAIPLATLVTKGTAVAGLPDGVEDLPKAEDDHAHDYVNDAADTDHARFQEGQLCENCQFWVDYVDGDWGYCEHPNFTDVLVRGEGWCSVYAPA